MNALKLLSSSSVVLERRCLPRRCVHIWNIDVHLPQPDDFCDRCYQHCPTNWGEFFSFLFNGQCLFFWSHCLAFPLLLFPPVIYCLTPPVSGEAGAKTSDPLLCFIDWLHLLNSSAPTGISSHLPPAKGNCIPTREGGKNNAKSQIINLLRYYLGESSQCLF